MLDQTGKDSKRSKKNLASFVQFGNQQTTSPRVVIELRRILDSAPILVFASFSIQ